MAKVKITKTLDYMGISCIRLTKARGQINFREAWENLAREGCYGPKIMLMNISDELPIDLYEEGDEWTVYDLENIYPKMAEDKFNEGYEAAVNDYQTEINSYREKHNAHG